jgi:hypothetical protein
VTPRGRCLSAPDAIDDGEHRAGLLEFVFPGLQDALVAQQRHEEVELRGRRDDARVLQLLADVLRAGAGLDADLHDVVDR